MILSQNRATDNVYTKSMCVQLDKNLYICMVFCTCASLYYRKQQQKTILCFSIYSNAGFAQNYNCFSFTVALH